MKSYHSNFEEFLVMNLAVLYVAVPQAETMGCIGMLFLWILGRPQNLAAGNWSHGVLVWCILFQR